MKLLCILLAASACALAQVQVAASVEPAVVPHSPQIGASAEVLVGLGSYRAFGRTSGNWLGVKYTSLENTALASFKKELVDFDPCCTLVGVIQGGLSHGRYGAMAYGAGVQTHLGNDYEVTHGVYLNKRAGLPIFASVAVSLSKTF
jgi:hypothetical protein